MNNTSLLIVISILFIIGFFIAIHICNKRNDTIRQLELDKQKLEVLKIEELKDHFRREWEDEQRKLDYKKQFYTTEIKTNKIQLENQYKLDASKYTADIDKLKVQLQEKEKRYNEVNQDLDLYRKSKIKEIDNTAAEYEQRKQILISQSIDKYRNILIEQANQVVGNLTLQIDSTKEELNKVQTELEEKRSRRAAINEEIRRQREVEEQQDFYKIQLDPNDIDDVKILRDIAPRLRHPDAINKVIWTGYYQKPLAELRKRLLPNGDTSGVYKITRLKTNEIYIGQTTSVDKRWQEHVKSALGVGTLASSQLHRAMAADGCENFTFELLEAVPKDKLRERESYYIDFYDSKTYGLNSVTGDKNK